MDEYLLRSENGSSSLAREFTLPAIGGCWSHAPQADGRSIALLVKVLVETTEAAAGYCAGSRRRA